MPEMTEALARAIWDNAFAWAERQKSGPEIAELYAIEYQRMYADGDFGADGEHANHVVDWPAWVAKRLTTCPACGGPWALRCDASPDCRHLDCVDCGAGGSECRAGLPPGILPVRDVVQWPAADAD